MVSFPSPDPGAMISEPSLSKKPKGEGYTGKEAREFNAETQKRTSLQGTLSANMKHHHGTKFTSLKSQKWAHMS